MKWFHTKLGWIEHKEINTPVNTSYSLVPIPLMRGYFVLHYAASSYDST